MGPTSVRANDLRVLGDSDMINRLDKLFAGKDVKCKLFGDSIYPHVNSLTTYWKHTPMTERERLENHESVRIAIEWNYIVTASLFGYLINLDKLKVLSSKIVQIFTVFVLCYATVNGSISSSYFKLTLPNNMLEKYMQIERCLKHVVNLNKKKKC